MAGFVFVDPSLRIPVFSKDPFFNKDPGIQQPEFQWHGCFFSGIYQGTTFALAGLLGAALPELLLQLTRDSTLGV